MANYVMEHSGEELDEAIGYVLDNYKDVSPVTARAQDVLVGKIIVTPEGPVVGTYQGVVPPASWRKTASGDLVEISDGMAGWPLHSLAAEIRPVQDLHGYENPWPAGGGKNLLKNELTDGTNRGVTFSQNGDGTVNISGANDGTVYSARAITNTFATVSGVEYILSGGVSNDIMIRNVTANVADIGSGCAFTGDGTAHKIEIRVLQGVSVPSNTVVKPMIRLASVSDATYAPYSNICPISASESVTVKQNGASAVSVEFPDDPGTVYGGTMDFKTGALTVTHRIRTLDGSETWTSWTSSTHSVRCAATDMKAQGAGDPASWLAEDGAACDSLPVVAENAGVPCIRFYTPTPRFYVYYAESIDPSITSAATWMAWLAEHPINVVYPLAEPVTYQLAPQEMPLLAAGTNSFAADSGGVTVTYYSAPDDPTNPTVQSLQSSPVSLSMAAPTADPMDEPEEVEDE